MGSPEALPQAGNDAHQMRLGLTPSKTVGHVPGWQLSQGGAGRAGRGRCHRAGGQCAVRCGEDGLTFTNRVAELGGGGDSDSKRRCGREEKGGARNSPAPSSLILCAAPLPSLQRPLSSSHAPAKCRGPPFFFLRPTPRLSSQPFQPLPAPACPPSSVVATSDNPPPLSSDVACTSSRASTLIQHFPVLYGANGLPAIIRAEAILSIAKSVS